MNKITRNTIEQKRAQRILSHLLETGQGFCYVPAEVGYRLAGIVSREDCEKIIGIAISLV